MTTPCDRIGDLGSESLEPEALSAHLEHCPECRRQLEVDALLRRSLGSLGGREVPAGLEARTIDRLRSRRPRLGFRQSLLLGTYWALALAASILLLLSFEPPNLGRLAGTTLLLSVVTALLAVVPLVRDAFARAGP